MRVRVYGTRGSVAVEGREYETFGGSTSCYVVEAGEQRIILDAGTGIARVDASAWDAPLHIFLSHLHLDHVAGLAMFGRLFVPGLKTFLHVPAASDEEANRAIDALFGPPYWPVHLRDLRGDIEVAAMPASLSFGDVLIESIEGSHPGGCKVYRISHADKVLVYATDFESEPELFERLVAFSQGADLVLFDGQFDEEQLRSRRGFGHSSPSAGVRLLRESGARRLLLIHHDPSSTDEVLLGREGLLGSDAMRLAREGELIEL